MSKPRLSKEEASTRRDEKRARVDGLIESGLSTLTDPEAWGYFLTQMSGNLSRYSFRNQMLIAAQCPGATDVSGFTAWLDRGRCVRKGETGILIFAPVTRQVPVDGAGKVLDRAVEPGDDTARKMSGIRIASVFDIAQTDALEGKAFKPLPGGRPVDLDALRATISELAGEHSDAILEALEASQSGDEAGELDDKALSSVS